MKNIEDLETISDDDLDLMSDDFYNDKSGSQTDMDELFTNKSDSSQFPDGNATNISTTSTDTPGDIKVMDILEIDWKSLITEKPRAEGESAAVDGSSTTTTESTAPKDSHAEYRKRNSTIALLNRIGFSHKFAGPALTEYIERQLAEQLKDQYRPMFGPIPALHCYHREKLEQREQFFGSNGASTDQVPTEMSLLNGAKIAAFTKFMETI